MKIVFMIAILISTSAFAELEHGLTFSVKKQPSQGYKEYRKQLASLITNDDVSNLHRTNAKGADNEITCIDLGEVDEERFDLIANQFKSLQTDLDIKVEKNSGSSNPGYCDNSYEDQAEANVKNFADGVYATMNRDTLKKNPQAKIKVYVSETRVSNAPKFGVYKIIRTVDDGKRCGATVWSEWGIPSLETDIDCSK